MNLKNIVDKIKLISLSLYLLVLYKLVLTPAVLEWSSLGVLLSVSIVGLLIIALPSETRIRYLVLAITFLMVNQALGNLYNVPLFINIVGSIIIFFVIFFISKYLGRITLGAFSVVFFTALIMNTAFYPFEYPLWSEFYVKWHSPSLYPKGMIDYFTLQVSDINNARGEEIIVQGDLNRAKNSDGKKDINDNFFRDEASTYLVFSWNGKTFDRLPVTEYSIRKMSESLKKDYLNFPYYGVNFKRSSVGIEQVLTPLFEPETLIGEAMAFGDVPFYAMVQDLKTIKYYEEAWKFIDPDAKIELHNKLIARIYDSMLIGEYKGQRFNIQTDGTAILGAANFLDDGSTQVIVSGDDMVIYNINPKGEIRILNRITEKDASNIGLADIVIGDVDSDGRDELMLNTEYAKILKLGRDGKWEVLWSSPDESFRFEGYARIGKNTIPEIIARSKSLVRQNKSRYITGYRYTSAGLEQKWRVFSDLTDLTLGDVDGDDHKEMIGYLPNKHIVFVLEKHGIPIVVLTYAFTACLILYGSYRKISNKKLQNKEIKQ